MSQQILVAAKNTIQRRHLEAQARRYDFDVITTEVGEEACDMALDIKPAGIVIGTDVRGSSRIRDGFEACRAIKLGLNARIAPTVMYSERPVTSADRLRAHECGAESIYEGAMSSIEVLNLISNILRQPDRIRKPPAELLLRIAELQHTNQTDEKGGFFCSYARASVSAAAPRIQSLADRKFPVWADWKNIKGGMEWEREVQRALKFAHAVLVFLDADSSGGEYLKEELRMAWLFELDVIPIRMDATPYSRFKPLHWNLPKLQFVDWLD